MIDVLSTHVGKASTFNNSIVISAQRKIKKMATSWYSAGESIESCSGVNRQLTQSATEVQSMLDRHAGRSRRKWQFRGIGSSSILLILTWEFMICCSLGFPVYRIEYLHRHSRNQDDNDYVSLWLMQGKYLFGIAALSTILLPIVGLLAQVAVGRYKLISYSLRTLWILSAIASIISIIEEILPVANTTLLTVQLLMTLIPGLWFLGAFIASAVPLGIDQITGGSAANISAFIQWFSWAFFSGLATSSIIGSILYDCTGLEANKVSTIVSLLSVLLLSVGLILDFCFHHKLIKEPVTVNPVSLIFKVLKYAVKHKYPVQRSAFTYCENEQPTRLDYGKLKYGGPFTTEQVEDVKTFWRMLLVIVVLSTFLLPFTQQFESALDMERSLPKTNCFGEIRHAIFSPCTIIMYSLPLYELLIYPCLRNRGPSILQSAGIGAAALIASSLYCIIAETTREALSESTNECMFIQTDHTESKLQPFSIPFNHLLAFSVLLLYKSSIKFICAQAPYNMSGLLIGLYFNLDTFFFTLGAILYEVWKHKWFAVLDTSTCGIWFYLTTLVLAVVSSAVLGLVIRWYKARERDEITRSQDLVEEIYDRYQEQAPQD